MLKILNGDKTAAKWLVKQRYSKQQTNCKTQGESFLFLFSSKNGI